MEWWGYLVAGVGVVGTLSGVWLGWTAHKREGTKEIKSDAETAAVLRVDMDYIKRGIDDIRLEQRTQRSELKELAESVRAVEGSASSAHKRIDRLDRLVDAKA